MQRRTALGRIAALSLAPLWLSACDREPAGVRSQAIASASPPPASPRPASRIPPVDKTDEQWRQLLPPERYRILFKEGTEPPNSSPLDNETRDGTFICAACFQPLFESAHKYDSGTGWPSFFDHLPGALDTKRDFKLIWPRTEYHCSRCGGHQGHVFNDGPQPTGKRWCNNGLALEFVPRGEPLPELRT